MQDGFVADVGDYGKCGLLRALCNLDGRQPGRRFRLGVVWYFVEGKEVGEVTEYSNHRGCDPILFDNLKRVRMGSRSVAVIEQSGILGADTLF